MDSAAGLDLLFPAARSVMPTIVLGCSISSPVSIPWLRTASSKQIIFTSKPSIIRVTEYPIREVNILARAGLGRFSGATHGSNSRRRGRRRRPIQQEDDSDGGSKTDEIEVVHDMADKATEGNVLYDDTSEDEGYESEYSIKNANTALDIHVYDDVHDTTFLSDKCYQEVGQEQSAHAKKLEAGREFEWIDNASIIRLAGKEDLHDERPRNDSINTAKDGRPSRGKKRKKKMVGNAKNAVITNAEEMDVISVGDGAPVSSALTTHTEIFKSSQMQEIQEFNEVSDSSSRQDSIRVGDAHSFGNLREKDKLNKKHPVETAEQKPIIIQTDRGKETSKVRETENAERPVDILGFLETVSSNKIKPRQDFRSAELDLRNLEVLSDKLAPFGVEESDFEGHDFEDASLLGPHQLSECARGEQEYVSDQAGLVFVEDSNLEEQNYDSARTSNLEVLLSDEPAPVRLEKSDFERQDSENASFLDPHLLSECARGKQEYVCDQSGLVFVSNSDLVEQNHDSAKTLHLQLQLKMVEGGEKYQSSNLKTMPHNSVAEPDEKSLPVPLVQVLPEEVVGQVSQLGNQLVEEVTEIAPKYCEEKVVQAQDIPNQVAEKVCQVVEPVTELLTDIKEQVGQMVEQIEKSPTQVVGQVSQVAEQVVQMVVDQVAEALPDPVVEQVNQVAEQVSQASEQFVERVTSHVVDSVAATASQVTEQVSSQIASLLSIDEDSDDEFEAYRSSDLPEFKGIQGLGNFTISKDDGGILSTIYDFYIFMLKRPLPEFVLGMFAAPILLSVIFTLLYLPEFDGLGFDETARAFFESSSASAPLGLQITWQTVFQVFMFSLSLSTGLQPELAPLSPYILVVANFNALIAQLIFVFLSGAVFARLSQPSQPVRCSTVALVCPPPRNRRLRKEACHTVFLTRYVLAGPQPSELVDVKVDLTYKYNTVTRSGTYFRTTQSLKLVRPEIAYLNHGMLVRHIIDETSPLYKRTQKMLETEDAIFSLSVVGLERSSMQSVFYVQHYCVYDGDVIWDAEFEDMMLINKKNMRIIDHKLLSRWRPVNPR